MAIRVFSPDDKVKLRALKRRISDVLETIDKVEDCGIDCQSRRDKLRDFSEVLDRIEEKFMQKL